MISMKIVRIRSKAIIFLVVFTVGSLLVTRIAVITSASNNDDVSAVHQKETKNIEKLFPKSAFTANDRREFESKLSDAKTVDVQKRQVNLTAAMQKIFFVGAQSKASNQSATNVSKPADVLTANLDSATYPILRNSNFVPHRRIVHLDLKGAPPQVHYFEKFFALIKSLGATGVLVEWEDMFPYSGELAVVRNAQAYSDSDIRTILKWAKDLDLEVVPLVQTFGHLEWILKHPEFSKMREVDRFAQVVCLTNQQAVDMVKLAIDQVMAFHKDVGEFFHMGADEAFQIGQCDRCQKAIRDEFGNSRDRLMVKHIATIAKYVHDKYDKRVLMWHDMLNNVDQAAVKEYKLGDLVEPVIWAYAENLNEYLTSDMWQRFANNFPYVWAASAFKGADGPDRWYSNINHYLQNHISWTTQMTREYKKFKEFRGIFLTGWQRFDHFAILCELLPVGIPSLAVNLITLKNGVYDKNAVAEAAQLMQCGSSFDINSQGIAGFCQFAGAKVYQFVQQFKVSQKSMRAQLLDDYMIRGWGSRFNVKHNYSSAWYLDQMVDKINMYYNELSNVARSLRTELSKIFFEDAVDEFLYTYVDEDLEQLRDLKQNALRMGNIKTFPARPFPILNAQPGSKTANQTNEIAKN